MQRGIGLGDVPGQGQHHGDGVLGSRDGVSAGGVEHDDAFLGGGLHVHVVDADTCSAYDFEPVRGFDDIGRYLRPAANDQGIVFSYLLDELFRREVGDNINVGSRLQPLYSLFC